VPYLGDGPQRYDLEPIASQHTDIGLPPGLVVLDEHRVGRKAGPNLLQPERGAALEGRKLLIRAAKLVQGSAQLLLEPTRALSQAFHPRGRSFLAADFLQFQLPI